MNVSTSSSSAQLGSEEANQPGPRQGPNPPKRTLGLAAIALPLCLAVGVAGLLAPDALTQAANAMTGTTFRALDWFFLAETTLFLGLCLWLAFSRFGHLRLGKDTDRPEFSNSAWLAMLFAAGMGSGLLFWGVAEPLTHFASPPVGVGGTPKAARHAMLLTNFHWGFSAWAIYGVAALVIAWFGFRKGTAALPGAPLRYVFRARWVEPVARLSDLLAVLAIAFGVAGSIAMGAMQFHSGLKTVAGVPDTDLVLLIIVAVLFVAYMTSAATSLDKGIRILSQLNMGVAVALLVFVLLAGPTAELLRAFGTAVGDYLTGLPGLTLTAYPYTDAGPWLHGWTITYLIWWIAWAPFVGLFIARISRGRTIREFVFGVVGLPTLFSILWFAVFGGTALHEELSGGGGIARAVAEDVTGALFLLFDRLPMSTLLGGAAISLVFVFLVTSADSATYVLGMLSRGGDLEPPTRTKLGWGVGLATLGAALLLSRRIDVIRSITVAGAIPYALIMLLQVAALFRSLRDEESQR